MGLLNLTLESDASRAALTAAELARLGGPRIGLALRSAFDAVSQAALTAIGQAELVVLEFSAESLAASISEARRVAARVGVIVASRREGEAALAAGCDLLVAKGHDGGGLVGEETSFVLIQSLRGATDAPLYVWGGVSWNTAAACLAAGCAGVVLDWQLALLPESPLPPAQRQRLARMDGSEIATLELNASRSLRFYQQPGVTARERLSSLATTAAQDAAEWAAELAALLSNNSTREPMLLFGQDAAFAADWAQQADSVGRALRRLEQRAAAQVRAAAQAKALNAGAPLAASHRTEFPIVQGPMTRVSDVADFCLAVAAEGGLPFLALALMGEQQVRSLLEQTKAQLGARSWGVGMLGFVPQEVRAAQWPVIQEIRPPFAIIAGGRPDQAASLEAHGIATYLHVPSPGMLDVFIKEKARRFVFEGRECGGHVGPRTSFVLWESMIRVLCEAQLTPEEAAQVHVLFAGGIHDGLGGAMVAALAQPLVERGMKIGVLLGTAYLFTHEIVATGAIVEGFQEVARSTDGTVVVESGPGHAIRCAKTDFVDLFASEKRRMIAEQRPHEEVRETLEHMNLGRLRIAAKGVTRATGRQDLEQLDAAQQRRDGMYMIGQVAALREGACSIRELHTEVCQGAVERLAEAAPLEIVAVDETPTPPPLDVAVIGMACLLPGGANDPGRFWHNLLMGHDPIGEIPADRFEAERWFDANRQARDKIYGKWGGFVDDVSFNPLKYGIPPASIPSIEPMQLLAIELVDRALRDAGYADRNPHLERSSVILGVGGGAGELGANYSFRSMLPRFVEGASETVWEQLPEWTEDSFAGILFNVVAGRVSNRFDFGGTNCTIDAACASSLAAIYWACQELALGRCDLAISGGCDTMQNPFGYLCFAKAGALSPRGRSRVFDAGADGIVISEGHAAVVLKRRADAERDGDKIYAVIRAVASGSDGRSKGLTAPRVEGQLRTLRRAYAQAQVDPASVELFEAHGTGTAVGDQTEGHSLAALLTEAGARPRSAAVGSAKSHVGHTKSAAGAVGLIKSVLALQHRVLPPTLHVEQPNPKAGLVEGPLYVSRDARPWLRGDEPRRAGVSAFGFGGTNFHVVLEEYDRGAQAAPLAARRDRPHELFLLRADTPRALRDAARALADEAANVSQAKVESGLARLALTHHLRSDAEKSLCAAFLAPSLDELQSALRSFESLLDDQGALTGKLPSGVFYEANPLRGPVAFLFPGQGSQHPGMLQDLAVEYSEVAACFETADRELAGALGARLSSFIFPPPAFTDAERSRAVEELKQTRFAQPALGVCGWAMSRLCAAFGIHSSMNAGHSFGELVALAASGVWSEAQLHQIAAARGRAMTREAGGTMLAVSAGAEAVRERLRGIEGVWVANLNGPSQTVLSGSDDGIAAAQTAFEAAGVSARRLPVSAAFHSPFMSEARESFRAALADAPCAAPSTPVYSNVTASAYSGAADDVRTLLTEQLTREVRFVEQVEAMHRDGARIFLELGPKGVLTGLVREILRGREHAAIATQPGGDDPQRQFLTALARLASHGVSLSLDRLYRGRGLEPLDRATLAGRLPAAANAHLWLVNGSYARKFGEPRRSTAPGASMKPLAIATERRPTDQATPTPATAPVSSNGSAPTSSNGPARSGVSSHGAGNGATSNGSTAHGSTPRGASPRAVAPATSPPLETQAPSQRAGGTMAPQDYSAFQETMRQFLATQETVLKHLFGGGGSVAAPTDNGHAHRNGHSLSDSHTHGHDHTAEPLFAAPPAALPQPVAPVVPAPSLPSAPVVEASQPVVAPTPKIDLGERLTQIVSERTGYPTDMLSLDINLESDLGVDSIKRVEVIAAFRREARPDMLEPPPELMERLTAAKTMRAILACFAEPAVAEAPTQPTAAHSAPASSTPWPARLCEIVSERTGYPPDMLSLEVNLESELGIDSIKRVEIIAAFRREARPDMQEPPPELMERLTAAKTMQAILDCFADPSAAASAMPPAAATVVVPAVSTASRAARLCEIVSERTGYPQDMLELDVNLESDLGIDSIKRVEIIAAFRREARPDMQEPPPELMERLTAAKTMRAILDCFDEQVPTPSPTSLSASQPPAPAGSTASRAARLCEIVSERTGYPQDMLELDVNLESDLGIDSIKRVEIIAAFRREVRPDMQEPPPELMERLTAAKTMRAILDCFAERAAEPLPPNVVVAPFPLITSTTPSALEATEVCPRCVPLVLETPIHHVESLGPGLVIFTRDEHGLADAWASRLVAAGHPVALLTPGDVASREAARAAIESLRQRHGAIAAVAHLAPLSGCDSWPEIDADEWRQRTAGEVKSLLYLLQAIEPELAATQGATPRVLAASLGSGDFTAPDLAIEGDDEATHPWRAGLAALLKVAACEWTRPAFRAVDFTALPDLDVLERELLAAGPVEIGYRRGHRVSLDVRRADLAEPESEAALFDSDGVVLVTGGAKGITAAIVTEIARHSPARFVLLGRSPLPVGEEPSAFASITDDAKLRQAIIADFRAKSKACTPPQIEAELARLKSDREVRKNLADIAATGATVEYLTCDIRDAAQLNGALDDLLARHGAVQALVHGAGIIEDRAIKDKSSDSFDRVVGVKVDPLLTLLRRLDPLALKLVALFASTSGYFGNSGQCDYAVANETLNRLARRLRSTWHGKVVAFNWGPWAGAGMVTPEVAEKMRSRGVSLIPLAAGCAAAWRELAAATDVDVRPIMGSGPWLESQRLRKHSVCDAAGPLLRGQAVERRDDGRVTARVTLDRNLPYLQDHSIEGRAVLPVAVAVGLMAETAHQAEPNWSVSSVENVRMLSGITVDQPRREIVLTAEPLERKANGGQWRVRITAPELPQRTLYEAHVHLAAALPASPRRESPQPIDAPLEASASEAYERWLFHGPAYQVIERFTGADERGIDAVVRGAGQGLVGGDDGEWVLDPVLVDAAPQLAMIWSRALFDVAVLPSRITRYRLYEPVGDGAVQMMLRMRPGADRQIYQADVWIVREGRVLAHMEGLEGAGSAQLNRIATHTTP